MAECGRARDARCPQVRQIDKQYAENAAPLPDGRSVQWRRMRRRLALNVAAVLSFFLLLSVVAVQLHFRNRILLREVDWRGQRWDAWITADGMVIWNDPQVKLERTA